MDVPGEDVDCHREVGEVEVGPNMVDQVCQDTVG